MTFHFKLHYWPGVTAAWFTITFITSYLIAVLDGNVYSFFPYISDTGAKPPESCIFGQMLNMGTVFMGITLYLRYKQVKYGLKICNDIVLNERWNEWSKWLGIVTCFGISLVANFQELSVPSVHFLGALMAFGVGTIYFLMQTWISAAFRSACYRNRCCGVDRNTLYIRLFLSFWFLPLFFGNMICSSISMSLYDGDILWWTEEADGFQLRLAGTFTEWIMAIFMFLYILTFTKEFKAMEYKKIEFQCKYK